MKLFDEVADAGRSLDRPWMTIGNFDGLHVGHRAVLESCVRRARAIGAPTLAMTFTPHPAAVLSPRGAPLALASLAQQEELLASVGIDGLLRQRFDATIASVSAEEFHAEWLVKRLSVRGIVVGSTFRFGAGRQGDVSSLRAWGGFDVVDVPPVIVDADVVSSSRVRRLVAEGRVAEAWQLLQRPHALEGIVVAGAGRGRTIGYPTANVVVNAQLPGIGVYACALRVGERRLAAVANIGRRPTFGGGEVLVEVHALEPPGDLYGAVVRVAFLARVRDEMRFSGVDDLVARIATDVEAARVVHARHPPESLAGPAF
jgi:riboflavin kinase/FMN adenylyltransferase